MDRDFKKLQEDFISYALSHSGVDYCPMCGSYDVEISARNDDWGSHYTIACLKCGCTNNDCSASTINISHAEAVEQVIKAWNQRSQIGGIRKDEKKIR